MSFFKSRSSTAHLGQKKGNETLCAVDLGSSRVRIAAGRVSNDMQLEILGFSEVPSAGIIKGAVTDISKLSQVLSGLLISFNEKYGISSNRYLVGVAGSFIESCNERGTATVQSGVITLADRNRAIENARAGISFNGNEFEIVHVIPQNFITETSAEIQNPVGQYAKRLEVNTHIIGCSKMQARNLCHVFTQLSSDFSVECLAYNGIAAADSVLTDGEKEIGVCLIDIGAGTVDVAIYDNKRLIFSFGFNEGGEYITTTIAKEYGISMKAAEQVKIQFGVADQRFLTEEEQSSIVEVPMIDNFTGIMNTVRISRYQLAASINRILRDIFRRIFDRITGFINSGKYNSLNLGAGYVITGGVAKTKFIERLLYESDMYGNYQEGTNAKIRVGHPLGVVSNLENRQILGESDKAVVLGLLRCGKRAALERQRMENDGSGASVGSAWKRFKLWIDREL